VEDERDLEDLPDNGAATPQAAAQVPPADISAVLMGLGTRGSEASFGPVLAALFMQNQGMLEHLTRRTPDPLLSALEGAPIGGEAGEGQRTSGLRGVSAREAWVRMIREQGPVIRGEIRTRLAAAMEVSPENLEAAALRGYFERKVPLGANKGITFFAYLLSKMWEYHELGKHDAAHTLVALGALFCEQTAIDQGRFQIGWLLTGLPQPAFNLTSGNLQRNHEEPYALLANPTWVSANLSYLKDMDYFEQRQRSVQTQPGGAAASSSTAGVSSPGPKAKVRPRRPKEKAKAASP